MTTTRYRRHDDEDIDKVVAEIKQCMLSEPEYICKTFLSNGYYSEREKCWRAGDAYNSPPSKGGIGSFSFVLDRGHREFGHGKDFGQPGEKRKDIWEIAQLNIQPKSGQSPFWALIEWGKNRYGAGRQLDPNVVRRAPRTDPAPAYSDEDKIRWSRRIWDEGTPIDNRRRSPAEMYLHNRGITMPFTMDVLRYHPACRYKVGGTTLGTFPALLAPVRCGDGSFNQTFRGIHRIYLTPDGYKADVPIVKMALGVIKQSAVRLCDDEAVGPVLGITEGIETGLAVMQLLEEQQVQVWSGISATGVEQMILPRYVSQPVHFADKDRAGIQAARKAAEIYRREGRSCHMLLPDSLAIAQEERGCNDFNELLQKRRGRTGAA